MALSSIRIRKLLTLVAVFAAITVLRWEVIDSPPYYDAVSQVWAEAEFLADSSFDYRALRYDEHHLLDIHSGKRAYMTTILPTALGLVMLYSPSVRATLIIYHLFNFFTASIALLALFAALRPKLDSLSAGLVAAAAILTPVFSTQIDMLASEMPLAACGSLCLWLVVSERFSLAAVAGLAGFLFKATGILFTGALIATLSLLWLSIRRRDPRKCRSVAVALVFSLALGALQLALLYWGGAVQLQIREGPPLIMAAAWCPDVILLGLAALLGFVWELLSIGKFRQPVDQASVGPTPRKLRAWEHNRSERPLPRRRIRFRRFVLSLTRWIANHYGLLYCGFVVLGTLCGITRVAFVPRYVAVTVPFIYWALANQWYPVVKVPLFRSGLIALIGLNIANWNGALFPDQFKLLESIWPTTTQTLAREGSFLERSHEYLIDHRENIEAVKAIERIHRAYPDDPIVTGMPFSCFLACPSMGYVSDAIPFYSINGLRDRISGCKEVPDLLRERPSHPLFLRTANVFYSQYLAWFDVPPPESEDRIVFQANPGSPVMIWRKEWSEKPSLEHVEAWYAKHAWPARQCREPWVLRIQSLVAAGQPEMARAELVKLFMASPYDPRLQSWIVMFETQPPRNRP